MLVGKSKIQLFDAKTGKEQLCVEHKNIVTKAIEYLLNPPKCTIEAGANFNNLFNQFMPVCTKGLGGLLLWDDNIAANPETIFPPTTINCVGHAGGNYSGTAVKRGTYNAAESGYIDNSDNAHIGYRHVWDFASDKANGTTKCLSLTHVKCGDAGYQSYDNDDSSLSCYYSLGIVLSASNGDFIGALSDDRDVFANISNSTLNLYIVHHTDLAQISMFDVAAKGGTTGSYTESYTINIGVSGISRYNADIYLKDGQVHLIYASSSLNIATITHIVVDIYSQKVVNSKKVTCAALPDDSRIYACIAGFFDGFYYLIAQHERSQRAQIYRLSEDGQTVTALLTPDMPFWDNLTSLNQYFGRFYDRKISWKYLIDSHGIIQQNLFYDSGDLRYMSIPTENPCYVYGTYNRYKYVTSLFNYLGTINNLDEPITKTASQTMKITYELSHATG